MNGFIPWPAQLPGGTTVIGAQHFWLSQILETLDGNLPPDNARQAVGECLELLLSGLLQSLVSVEQEQGLQAGQQLVARHNALCLTILNLLQSHSQGQSVELELLGCLQDWLGRDNTNR